MMRQSSPGEGRGITKRRHRVARTADWSMDDGTSGDESSRRTSFQRSQPQHYQSLAKSSSTSDLNHRTSPSTLIELSRLDDYHVVYRTPHAVTDRNYHHFVHDEEGEDCIFRSSKDAPMVTKTCCVSTCASFSLIGMVFLLWVGLLLDTQPFYIKGALPLQETYITNSSGRIRSRDVHVLPLERLMLATTAYHAALAYFLAYVACRIILNPSWIQTQWTRRNYANIPELPLYHDSNAPNPNGTAAIGAFEPRYHCYRTGLCERVLAWFRRVSVDRGWSPYSKRGKHTPKTI